MKKSDKPIYNYNYLKGEEAYIKCAECGAECLCHDGEYECSVCGNTGWTGEPMPEIDDQKWFEAQCLEQGICAEDIFVVGDYATNKEGDFLYSVTHEEGEDTMNYVAACDLIDCESNYAEWLLNLMQNLEEGYREGDMILTTRSESDWREIAQVFKECICRNQEFNEEYRNELKQKPAVGVYEPDASVQIDSRMGKYLGMRDTEHTSYENVPAVILPREFEGMGGYRFALKVVDLNNFVEIYSNIQEEGQHKPFRILADLEEKVEQDWKNEGKVLEEHYIDTYDEGFGPGHGADMAWFRFSHFEVDNEIDDRYRTFYACYTINFDK